MKKRCTAVVLAAGSGSRMKSSTAKQFMLLDGKPLIWYSLHAVEQSRVIDDCVLVTGAEDIPYVRREILGKYNLRKVSLVVAGGRERSESVYNALCAMATEGMKAPNGDGYVFIHDGARPFVTEALLESLYEQVCRYRACVAAVPVKDTIKIADESGFVAQTPERKRLWAVQTPQVFETALITEAYCRLFEAPQGRQKGEEHIPMTDDAMVLENMLKVPVKLVESSYENIKITTPEDIRTAEGICAERAEKPEKKAGDKAAEKSA